jgi:hypothetical protein
LACAVACAPAASTTGLDQPPPPPRAQTLEDLAANLAGGDHEPARIRTYLAPLRLLERRCRGGSVVVVSNAVDYLAGVVANARIDLPPGASAEAVLASDAHSGADCMKLAEDIGREVEGAVPHTQAGWGGYAGTLTAWRLAHHDSRFIRSLSTSGRVFSVIRRFRTPLTAALALASIERSLLPGKVHVVYALTAAECQQAIYMGPTLGALFGNSSLGAFVELSTGKGVGRTHYDKNKVNRARITPLGRIGGQPCT